MLTIYDIINLMPDTDETEKTNIRNNLKVCEEIDNLLFSLPKDEKMQALATLMEIYANRQTEEGEINE